MAAFAERGYNNPVLDGLPELGRYVTDLVLNAGPRDSLAVVVLHHAGDLLNAVCHALGHYLPITLDEPYLRNSSIGTPYQKWAKFTNEDFSRADECLRRLLVASHAYYQRAYDPLAGARHGNNKDAEYWFRTVARQYVSFRADEMRPCVTVGSVHLAGWVGPDAPVFLDVQGSHLPVAASAPVPDVITSRTIPIEDRSALTALFPRARANRDGLAEAVTRLAAGLRKVCTIDGVIAPHRGTLSDYPMGVATVAGPPPH